MSGLEKGYLLLVVELKWKKQKQPAIRSMDGTFNFTNYQDLI